MKTNHGRRTPSELDEKSIPFHKPGFAAVVAPQLNLAVTPDIICIHTGLVTTTVVYNDW